MALDYKFEISPEKEASVPQFLYRQFLVNPDPISPKEVSLKGKTAIVTGSNTGIGYECAKQLLALGVSKLILAVRDESKGAAAKKTLTAADVDVQVWKLDLSSYDSISEFVAQAKTLERLDIVILNAGVWRQSEVFNDKTGFEEIVQVNYLSNMLLAILLLPVFQSKKAITGEPGRLVLVSSDTAALTKFSERGTKPLLPHYKNPSKKPDMFQRYATSKLLGQFAVTELSKRVPPSVAIITCPNPGLCHGSGLQRDGADSVVGKVTRVVERIVGRSCETGARTIVDAAVRHGEEVHGHYLENYKIRPMAPVIYSQDGRALAASLWEELLDELAFADARGIVQGLA
jgi:NAD(P)-dependent dehydrogenase (short-subunit alcohol dehydrogenase family)